MEIVVGRSYRFVVRFPWGERKEFACTAVLREGDGTIRWRERGGVGLEPYCDCVVREEEGWVMGFLSGTPDVLVVISCCEDAPEP